MDKMQRYAELEIGKTYKNKNGITYMCVDAVTNSFKLVSEGGYCLWAHNITMYDDGAIEWDFSTKGYFINPEAVK